jgi:hypothetical protein
MLSEAVQNGGGITSLNWALALRRERWSGVWVHNKSLPAFRGTVET